MEQYKVIKPFKGCTVGQIVNDSTLRIRRKIVEGGCLEKLPGNIPERKMQPKSAENKNMPNGHKNKSSEGGA